jgi:hypothetical protein
MSYLRKFIETPDSQVVRPVQFDLETARTDGIHTTEDRHVPARMNKAQRYPPCGTLDHKREGPIRALRTETDQSSQDT